MLDVGGFYQSVIGSKATERELLELFSPAKSRLPSYSTIRRVLLDLDYEAYSRCLAEFFSIEPLAGETIAIDGKVLRGSYNLDTPASTTEFHPAIQLVTVYVVERGLMQADSTCGL